MNAIQSSPRHSQDAPKGEAATKANAAKALPWLLAAIRISIGWVFLWAFLDKTFGLGRSTPSAQSWLNGGSPTYGFLSSAATGPFEGIYSGIAGDAWADWLFMVGLLGIGVALIAGAGIRIASIAGALLLVLMWTAVLPPATNPFMDDHLIYAMVLLALPTLGAARHLGLGQWWESQPLVQQHRWLR